MATRTRTEVSATLERVRPSRCIPQHGLETDKVDAIVAAVCGGRSRWDLTDADWTLPPLLVVEEDGEYLLLDGHHRARAARDLEMTEIPAYVLTVADYGKIVEEEFGGYAPGRYSDIDDYIRCDGLPYDREAHTHWIRGTPEAR